MLPPVRRWLLVGLLLSAVTWVPGARGAVRITGQSIELSSSTGARTVVDRSPFRVSFYDRHGHRVLAEAPGGWLSPSPLPRPSRSSG